MAAPGKHSKKKIVVNKDDLRRLMREKKSSINAKPSKIDSPLAKYNSLGQLSCVVCSCNLKNDLLWPAHIQGKTHREHLARLKAEKEQRDEHIVQPPAVPPGGTKRKATTDLHSSTKIPKGAQKDPNASSLPSDFVEAPVFGRKPAVPLKSALKSALKKPQAASSTLGLGGYSSSEEDDEAPRAPAAPPEAAAAAAVAGGHLPGGLPADFFDPSVQPSVKNEDKDPATEEAKIQSMAEKLPEGFFDDAKMDAKVRKVEYRDKMEDEWELFQKEIKTQGAVSEAIIEEEDEQVNAERKIAEIDEQMHQWSKIDKLAKQKEEIMAKEKDAEKPDEEGTDDVDEQEFEEFLDWRTKKAWTS